MAVSKGVIIFIVCLSLVSIATLIALVVVLTVRVEVLSLPMPTLSPVPPGAAPIYYGKDAGELSRLDHDLSGHVYVLDNKRIRIRDLTYDGRAPEAFFWIGIKGKSNDLPDTSGEETADENGSITKITKAYNKNDVTLRLGDNITVADLKWFGMWCKRVRMSFGHVFFPFNFDVPRPVVIGRFEVQGMSVSSGPISVLDHKTVLVETFSHNGRIDNLFFVAGNGTGPNVSNSLVKLPRQDGGLSPIPPAGSDGAVRDVNVTLNFPDNLSIFQVDFISIYSSSIPQVFGSVSLPKHLNVPPYTP